MSDGQLGDIWRMRNAAAVTLGLAEDQTRRAIATASVDDLVGLIETFSPARSTGPDWTRTFEPFIERLWTWRDAETIAALAEVFRARGGPWAAVTNALSPQQGEHVRETLQHQAWSRLPAFTTI